MSDRLSFGVTFIEKILGIITAVIGALLVYYTYYSPDVPAIASFFYFGGGLILVVIGVILVIAKTE